MFEKLMKEEKIHDWTWAASNLQIFPGIKLEIILNSMS